MMEIDIAAVVASFDELLTSVEGDEKVAITRSGRPVAWLVPALPQNKIRPDEARNGRRRLPALRQPDNPLSTVWRQPRILVDVHPAPPRIAKASATSASPTGAGWTTYGKLTARAQRADRNVAPRVRHAGG